MANSTSNVAKGTDATEAAAEKLSEMATTLWQLVQQYQLGPLSQNTEEVTLDDDSSDIELF